MRQRQKLEAVGALAGGIAHEFNNLLQVIQGFARFARAGLNEQDERAEDLDQVLIASEHAATLTRQLLNFGRLDQISFAQIEIGKTITSCMKSLRPLLREDIELSVSVDEDLPTINADANGIQQILMNLCVNAQDAMPQGGQLKISVDQWRFPDSDPREHPNSGDYVRIRVSDSGKGMSPDILERVFEPFFTTKDVGKGTGLGLAVVHGIIRRHEGMIRVYSEQGLGSTFRVYLPINANTVSQTTMQIAPKCGGKETILLAEDDPMVRHFSQRVLEDAGYRLLTATDGEEAVQLFRQHRDEISLCVFDVIMPKMTGRVAFEAVLSMDPNAKVVFCSGHDPALVQMTHHTMRKVASSKSLTTLITCSLPFVKRWIQRTCKPAVSWRYHHDRPQSASSHFGRR